MLLEKGLSGMMTVGYLLVRKAGMPLELGLIRDDSCFTYWFEGHGCLPNQGLSGMMAVLFTGSKDMDASRTRD